MVELVLLLALTVALSFSACAATDVLGGFTVTYRRDLDPPPAARRPGERLVQHTTPPVLAAIREQVDPRMPGNASAGSSTTSARAAHEAA